MSCLSLPGLYRGLLCDGSKLSTQLTQEGLLGHRVLEQVYWWALHILSNITSGAHHRLPHLTLLWPHVLTFMLPCSVQPKAKAYMIHSLTFLFTVFQKGSSSRA